MCVQGVQTLTQLELILRGELELRFKNSTKKHLQGSEKRRKHASETREALTHTSDGGKQNYGPSPGGRDQEEPGTKSESILSRWSWNDVFYAKKEKLF